MNDKPEHEASDPIRLPVRYDANRDALGAVVDAIGQRVLLPIDDSGRRRRALGEHIALCINERPQLLAETLRLREEVERLKSKLEYLKTLDLISLALKHRAALGQEVDTVEGGGDDGRTKNRV